MIAKQMFHLDSYPIQRGRGNFNVERYPLQRGRGLSNLFAGLLRKIVPFGRSFLKTGKNIIQSETGKSILNDTLQTAATAATTALLENDAEGAKKQLINSLKRSGSKTKDAVGKIAKNKLEQVLTGKGKLKREKRQNVRMTKNKKKKRKQISLLDD